MEEQGIIRIYPESSLEKEDFERLELMIDAWRKRHGALHGVMIQTGHFPGWRDLDAMLKHFRFVREHHDEVKKVALITNSALGDLAPYIADLFVNAEVQGFSLEDEKQAEAWLTEASETNEASE